MTLMTEGNGLLFVDADLIYHRRLVQNRCNGYSASQYYRYNRDTRFHQEISAGTKYLCHCYRFLFDLPNKYDSPSEYIAIPIAHNHP